MSTPRRQAQALTPFADRMQAARKRRNLTQAQVAKSLGLTQTTVSRLEIDAERSHYLAEFARLYGVDPMWLHFGVGDMHGGQDRGLSAEAEDLARTLDAIEDPEVKRRVYALSRLVADLGNLPFAAPPSQPAKRPKQVTDTADASRPRRGRPSLKTQVAAGSPESTGSRTARRKTPA